MPKMTLTRRSKEIRTDKTTLPRLIARSANDEAIRHIKQISSPFTGFAMTYPNNHDAFTTRKIT